MYFVYEHVSIGVFTTIEPISYHSFDIFRTLGMAPALLALDAKSSWLQQCVVAGVKLQRQELERC